jgi:membrane protein DedA with SNARE-associated domain
MIFQQAVIFPSWEVFAISGAAMALGLLSYYIAGARTARSYQAGDADSAQAVADDAGMLDDVEPASAAAAATATRPSTMKRLEGRLSKSLQKAQAKAQPAIEQHGVRGMFVLCFGPTPLGTAAAFVGGLMGFGFARYLATSFAAKYLLAGVIVAAGLLFSEAARSVDLPL